MEYCVPSPVIRQRPLKTSIFEHFQQQGIDPILSRLMASRFPMEGEWQLLWQPKVSNLNYPHLLKNIEQAAWRIVHAMDQGQIIALETDHDCDGQTSHAVLWSALVECFAYPEHKVISFIGHRLEEGYGLSEALMNRILQHQPRPNLVITADNGSSDEARIKILAEQGIEVIVSDHHEIPMSGIPKSAFAVVNPSQEGCLYPDKSIAGCMVAWLLMAQVRACYLQRGQKVPSLAPLLDFVAVGTIADCVSLGTSINNRAVVRYGMQWIEKGSRPCWRAIKPLLKGGRLRSEDLGFVIGPLLNSDGRLSDAMTSVSFLLSKTDEEANNWVQHLLKQNQVRKQIQRQLTEQAMRQAAQQVSQGSHSVCVFLEEGHSGVHGISASRLKDAFGRPTVLFSPKLGYPHLMTGSARSIEGFHIREAFERAIQRIPQGVIGFGGHAGAAGITLEKSVFSDFQQAFEGVCREQLLPDDMGPVIWSDGVLPEEYWNLSFFYELESALHPFGRGFEAPVFETEARILQWQKVGDGTHLKLVVKLDSGLRYSAIWFQALKHAEAPLPIEVGGRVRLLFRLMANVFRNEENLDLQVVHLLAT